LTGVAESNEAAGRLSGAEISNLRHELRTPVNQIVGYCEMLLEDSDEPQYLPRQQPLRDALTAVREVLKLIDAALPTNKNSIGAEEVASLYESLTVPQMRIIEAMSELAAGAGSLPDGAFVADIRRIRNAAELLVPADGVGTETVNALDPPVEAEAPATVSPRAQPALKGRILVVDDLEANRGVLERRLQREGHTVACAASGLEALAIIGKEPFDIVLLDVMMPGMNGYEALEKLKASPETRDISVIMISALDDIGSIVRCIEHGAEDYLPKPFDPVLLRARISASLEKKVLREREREYMRDVTRVVAAAVSVERGSYSTGTLAQVAQRSDELGTLARVFDSMMAGIRAREETLRSQVDRLREEIQGVTGGPMENEGSGLGVLKTADIFGSRYRIERTVGSGGMGMVYLAEDLELGEKVAIKTLRPELLTSDETAIERFRNEIRLARRMAHRNIVRTHDFGNADGVYFVTMEYVEGTTLRAVLERRGHLGAPATLAIARQLAEALQCAHQEGIIHRDIKPQNLLLDSSGTLKVSDFGVARLAQKGAHSLTQTGMVVGTPAYMAPEQLLEEEVDARSDLYSVGVVLYECLTGRPPYQAKSAISLIAKILHETAEAPDIVAPEVPPAVSALVMQLLAKSVGERIQSAGALGQMLATIQ
jgi:CheY-like chemotaxis protein